jgi:drug/metabolite transporter (DMT)-like permease
MMNQQSKGVLAIIGGALCYGMYGVFVRNSSDVFGVFSQNYVRSLIIFIFLFIYLQLHGEVWKKIRNMDKKWLLSWLLSGSLLMITLYPAFNNLPIGTAYFLFYSTMIVAGLLMGKILFGERMSSTQYLSLLLVLVGMLLIFTVELSGETSLYIGFALFGGMLTGIWNTLSKKISNTYSEYQLMIYSAIATFFVAVIGGFLVNEPIPSLTFNASWLWIIGYATAQFVATWLLIYGFKHLSAQTASLIMPMEIVFASFFGYIFFFEILDPISMVGGLFIFAAALLPSISEIRKSRA